MAMGGCTEEVVMNPIFCHLYWNRVLVLDELMIQDSVMMSLDDVVVQGWTYNGCSSYAGLMGCLLIMYWPSFFGLEDLLWWLLSLWPCISLTVCHPSVSSLSNPRRAVLPSHQTGRMPLWPYPH